MTKKTGCRHFIESSAVAVGVTFFGSTAVDGLLSVPAMENASTVDI
jgi:hypothetical protein